MVPIFTHFFTFEIVVIGLVSATSGSDRGGSDDDDDDDDDDSEEGDSEAEDSDELSGGGGGGGGGGDSFLDLGIRLYSDGGAVVDNKKRASARSIRGRVSSGKTV